MLLYKKSTECFTTNKSFTRWDFNVHGWMKWKERMDGSWLLFYNCLPFCFCSRWRRSLQVLLVCCQMWLYVSGDNTVSLQRFSSPPPPPAQIWISRPFHLLLIHQFCLFISALNHCTLTQVMNACAVLSWWWWSVLTGWVAHLPGWWSGNLSSYLSGFGCRPVQTHNKSFWILSQ